jgi:Raf kinase inhibitor-like YbhB/YbcL family protein
MRNRLSPRFGALAAVLATAGLLAAACNDEEDLPSVAVTSLAFGDGETIPKRHTCDGAEASPPLRFEGAPAATGSYAVLMYRADEGQAATALWIAWGITAAAAGLDEGVPRGEAPSPGVFQGTNDEGVIGYSGPCALEVAEGEDPDTATHRYLFQAYALSAGPAIDPGATAAELLMAIDGLVVGQGTLEGFYGAD